MSLPRLKKREDSMKYRQTHDNLLNAFLLHFDPEKLAEYSQEFYFENQQDIERTKTEARHGNPYALDAFAGYLQREPTAEHLTKAMTYYYHLTKCIKVTFFIRTEIESLLETSSGICLENPNLTERTRYIYHSAILIDSFFSNEKALSTIQTTLLRELSTVAASAINSTEFKEFNILSNQDDWEQIKKLILKPLPKRFSPDTLFEQILREKYVYYKVNKDQPIHDSYLEAFKPFIEEDTECEKELKAATEEEEKIEEQQKARHDAIAKEHQNREKPSLMRGVHSFLWHTEADSDLKRKRDTTLLLEQEGKTDTVRLTKPKPRY